MPRLATEWVTINRIQPVQGYLLGFRSQSLIASITLANSPRNSLDRLFSVSQILLEHLRTRNPQIPLVAPREAGQNPLLYVCHWLQAIFEVCNLPVFDKGLALRQAGSSFLLVVPVFSSQYKITESVLKWLTRTVNLAAAGGRIDSHINQLPGILDQITSGVKMGTNVPRFLRAAFDAGIQATPIGGMIFQYGQGSRARWLESSHTDETPYISALLARNKYMAASVLRQAGIPVPDHTMVKSPEEAKARAARLGYPVVVKPADTEGGTAVAAGLTCADEVVNAYGDAIKVSRNILVEKHIPGRDYRINILHHQVLWAIERIPAGLTGDGVQTIQELIDAANSDPRRGEGKHALLQKLVVDDEARKVLGDAGLTPESIPAKGHFVALRRRANIGMGGMPAAIPIDEIHPDNSDLALRATAALRLDIAGVDLLLPDIRRSWRETGGVICEVNSQPQLGGVTSAHVYRQVLEALVPNQGRIPAALILGASSQSTLGQDIYRYLRDQGIKAGIADR